MTNGEHAQALSETIKQRLLALPGASRVIAELSEAALVAALLTLLTESLINSVDSQEMAHIAETIFRCGNRLGELIAIFPFAETPPELEGVLIQAHEALVLHGLVPGANRPRS